MTHKQRVLELLSDREPHSHREGYRLGVMLHSRVSDLRRDGHTIRAWREGDIYMYQLEGAAFVLDAVEVQSVRDASPSRPDGTGGMASAASSTTQLDLFAEVAA